MLLPVLLLLTLPSLSGKSGPTNKTKCDFQITPYFSSWNFNNNLTWKPPENSKGLLYTVQYKEYGSEYWQKKLECTNITLTWCDLTIETNGTGAYIGKVIINNKTCFKSIRTERFYPQRDTTIGPPTVNLFLGNASIEIKLTHPIKLLHDKFKGLKYRIYLDNVPVKETEEPYYEIKDVELGTQYCITAEVYWFSRSGKSSEKTCITTNADRTSQETITGMICILAVTLIFCTITALAYATHKYIHGSNLEQPTILNITTSKSNNAILVDAHTLTINIITIESGKPNLQDTMLPGKDDKEFQNQTDLQITGGEDHISCDSGVIEEAGEESEDDPGYVSLQEQITTARPTISPYDMPHHLHEPLSTSTDIVYEEGDLYGHIKSIDSLSPVKENDELDVIPNGYTSEKTIVDYPYVPQGDSDFLILGKLKEDFYEADTSFMDQELGRLNVIEDMDLNESSTLFIDWSPDNPSFYIPNLSKKRELENCIKQCQEEKDGLLSQLYVPPEVTETSKDDELGQLEERWGLLIQAVEK